jgi:quercetin dioxygenase-like cupin family protein
MNRSNEPVFLQPGSGHTIGVVGDVYRILATGDDTNGKYAMIDAIVPPGGGPPPHVHSREEEAFYVLEGELTFYIGNKRFVAGPGAFANTSVGTEHYFKNETQHSARMLITVTPAGLEKMFLEIAQPVVPGATSAPRPTKEIIDKLPTIASHYGITLKLPAH